MTPVQLCTVIPGRAKREPGIHNHDNEYGFRSCASGRQSPTEGPSRNDTGLIQTPAAFASLIASHTFIGVSGVVSVLMPNSLSASITPLAMQGGPPMAPD